MINCPCCANTMLRHIRHQGIYWFCPHCYQEMPDLETLLKKPRFLLTQDLPKIAFGQKEKVLMAAV